MQYVPLILRQCESCGPGGETDDSLITGLQHVLEHTEPQVVPSGFMLITVVDGRLIELFCQANIYLLVFLCLVKSTCFYNPIILVFLFVLYASCTVIVYCRSTSSAAIVFCFWLTTKTLKNRTVRQQRTTNPGGPFPSRAPRYKS